MSSGGFPFSLNFRTGRNKWQSISKLTVLLVQLAVCRSCCCLVKNYNTMAIRTQYLNSGHGFHKCHTSVRRASLYGWWKYANYFFSVPTSDLIKMGRKQYQSRRPFWSQRTLISWSGWFLYLPLPHCSLLLCLHQERYNQLRTTRKNLHDPMKRWMTDWLGYPLSVASIRIGELVNSAEI